MHYRTLGRTGLKVSALTMGTFTFGGRDAFGMAGSQGVADARRLVDVCVDHGVNLFDTANMYSTGLSEEILGEVLEGRGDDLLVTSKARMPIGPGPNDEGTSRHHLIRECERSLKRLRRDHIDVYYVHEWDGTTPVEETMAALDTLVQHGKVRYVGCSNYSAWHVMKSLAAADRRHAARFATQQIHYTLEAREAEYELLPLSVAEGLGVLVWSPLAAGLLSGKHRRGQPAPEGSRQAAGWDEPPIRDTERLWNIVDALVEIGDAHGVSAARVALAWLLTRPAVASLVVGGRTAEQFEDSLRAVDLTLSGDELTAPRRRQPSAADLPLLAPAQLRAATLLGRRSRAARQLPRSQVRRRGPARLNVVQPSRSASARTIVRIASMPGSSMPTVLSPYMRARPTVARVSRNASSASSTALAAASATASASLSPAVAFATASRLSSTVLPPSSALPRVRIASRAAATSSETRAGATSVSPFSAFAIAIRPVAVSVP